MGNPSVHPPPPQSQPCPQGRKLNSGAWLALNQRVHPFITIHHNYNRAYNCIFRPSPLVSTSRFVRCFDVLVLVCWFRVEFIRWLLDGRSNQSMVDQLQPLASIIFSLILKAWLVALIILFHSNIFSSIQISSQRPPMKNSIMNGLDNGRVIFARPSNLYWLSENAPFYCNLIRASLL